MRINSFKTILTRCVRGAAVLLFGAGMASAQQQINLTAAATTTTLPDGSSVPMWGYSCGTPVVGSTATCKAANPNAAGTWSPVIITVPTLQSLQINLTNNLPSPVPTSLTIVGQVGGGMGKVGTTCSGSDANGATCTPAPDHSAAQTTTWPIADPTTTGTPPSQGPRVQSFATEIAAGGMGSLTWTTPRAGTYLLESGTHPSIQATMGLIGMVVVTTAPVPGPTALSPTTPGTAYPGTAYNADVSLILSEIDPDQNRAVAKAVGTAGFSESATYNPSFKGPVAEVTVSSGGSGYTTAPAVHFSAGNPTTATGTAVVDTTVGSPTIGQVTSITITGGGNYATAPTVTIDPPTSGSGAAATATLQLNSALSHCSGADACYPPVVNYRPLYYLVDGVAFNKTHALGSLFKASPAGGVAPGTGKVLVRLVNAGSRMHVPSIVGSVIGAGATPPGGFSLIAEDGNPLPGLARVQSEVFMAAGKTYDVMINGPAAGGTALPIYDRELSLSANATARDAGMFAYISVNNAGVPNAPSLGAAIAADDIYPALNPGITLTVSDPVKGVIANDTNVFGVNLLAPPASGTVTLQPNGTFTYVPNTGSTATSDSFTYCANGTVTGGVCSSNITATVHLNASTVLTGDTLSVCTPASNCTFRASTDVTLTVKTPGILAGAIDSKSLPVTVDTTVAPTLHDGLNAVKLDENGGFIATLTNPCGVPAGCTASFDFKARNSLGTPATGTATIVFPVGSGLTINVLDGADKSTVITDYRWIIEEDRTFFVDPNCARPDPATNKLPAGCPTLANGTPPNFGTNFHTSYMPVVATGCTDTVSCGVGQTVLGDASTAPVKTPSKPGDVALCPSPQTNPLTTNCLDPNKRYYISVLPGDAAQPFVAGYAGSGCQNGASNATSDATCGHGMGGAAVAKVAATQTYATQPVITVYTEPSPYPPATLTVFVFEDDFPLNGEHDASGGVDILAPNEAGLGGFQITLQDDAGGTGDATGTPTYDMFNMPLSNSLAGTIDPVSKLDACPISKQTTANAEMSGTAATPDQCTADPTLKGCQKGTVGMIITCPTFESDGTTFSPLAGQAVVKNLYQGRYGVVANPGADRIARGEEWLQTNTLDGQKAHDSFMRIGEPAYFQEFGPAGYHVTIGFANPAIINARGAEMCDSTKHAHPDCTHEVKGHITTARMSRTPDERLYGSGTHDSYSFTQCYVSIGDPDGAEFGFQKCDADGNFDFTNLPPGNWKVTTFDQWNDQVVDGITTATGLCGKSIDPVSGNSTLTNCLSSKDMGEMAVHQWQANIYTRTFLDTDYSGVSTDQKPGLPLVATNIRFRDGSYSNFNNTDLSGNAGFNEVFPLFNWYVIETDSTRYKNTGTHVVYDSGGPVDNPTDGSPTGLICSAGGSASKACEKTGIAANLANTYEYNPLPANLSVPGARYCDLMDTADCNNEAIRDGYKQSKDTASMSTGRIDPAWVNSYGWQGYSGQNNFLEFGKRPFAPGENGGIHGHVVYASTRPFDDPRLLLQLSWEPLVPHVKLNLYKEDVAGDGVTKTLTLVDHTETTSFDDWAQGFRTDNIPNMNCPGQGTPTSPMPDTYFFFALKDQPQWLDLYKNGAGGTTALPNDAQFKCYDGMHNWNQLQPAPYDGMYSFPSVVALDPTTGKPAGTGNTNGTPGAQTGTNCTICIKNPTVPTSSDPTAPNFDPYRSGTAMLPAGKYVVEVVVPEGYELVKEEDKNILIGDNFIAPAVQQFGGLGTVYILPDQASVTDAYNSNNSQNGTTDLGRTTLPSTEGDTGSVEQFWPCVGAERVVPDYISLFPTSQEVAPFAGAKRNLCDRKEVTVTDEASVLTKFYIFTETHAASHFTGVITDDFTAEFDPFSPQFGEKYGPAFLPVQFKDWAGNNLERVYSDSWGAYNGLSYSTWEVNPPNPTGYGPTMLVGCMNDAGEKSDGSTDPLFQEGYSQFCYELPFMPGQTGYFDTPVVPTAAFAGGYNNPDCSYPDATPAIREVDGDGVGPWVANAGGTVASVIVSNGGVYTSAPNVTFTAAPAGGVTAAGTAVLGPNGKVSSTVTVTASGTGYTSAPTVAFSAPPAGGTTATGTSVVSGVVQSVAVNNQGSNYFLGASVTFTGGGGTGAAATATVTAGKVTKVTVTNGGSGYTSAPTVKINGSILGVTATGTATIARGVVSVTVTNSGAGYTSAPTVTFTSGGGTGAAATAALQQGVASVTITNAGGGYLAAPAVTFSGTGGALASATLSTGGKLTIYALGNQTVDNYEYVGPSATVSPYNQQKITRHYGFGTTAGTVALVGLDGVAHNLTLVGGWADDKLVVNVPGGIPNCAVQQQTQYGGLPAQCGELVITTASGKQSVDTVTVTIGGKQPTVLTATDPLTASGIGSIQKAIDAAKPGDMIIVGPGVHSEMVLMWKPVRLQGVGAATSVIDANPQPAGKLDPWRREVVCLFGLATNGQPSTGATGGNPFDPTSTFQCGPGLANFSGGPNFPTMVVDRMPMEGILGWDTTVNGNLAEQLIEPSLLGAYEGAGITVLAKGVNIPAGSADVWGSGAEAAFPAGTVTLKRSDCTTGSNGTNLYPSNFLCNPSSIDGLAIKNSSQGGGAILVHAWGHELQIANNRISNNQGTMSGGITIGQGEHPDVPLVGGGVATIPPGSCITDPGTPVNLALPYCYDLDVNVHHNLVIHNSSLGDELFSSTPAGAGGVTFCNGSDYYKFNYNWICGNLSTGDGAGVAHIGFSYDGDIEHNTIIFNQSTNPSIVTNGGGLLVMGAPDPDPPCATNDQDCVSPANSITPSDGTGPGLVINANLILGNSADSGSGGGLRMQHINGTDVVNFGNGSATQRWPVIPTVVPDVPHQSAQPGFQTSTAWNAILVTNNVISNNVAGWDGGGVSLQDALATSLVNNTIVNNNSTASSGVLFQSLFAPLASTQGTNCSSSTTNNSLTTEQSCPQPAGLVSVTNSAVLVANLPAQVTCPTGHGTGGNCAQYSVPALYNNIFWQNRSLVVSFVDGQTNNQFTNQQNTISVYNPGFGGAASSPALTQGKTGDCSDTKASYWDLGVRGDKGPGDHTGGTLAPNFSLLTNSSEIGTGTNNLTGDNPSLTGLYCNGSLVPVEAAGSVPGSPYPGWDVPPGTNESNALPAPAFTLQAAGTVDEGNNWINLHWGPLSLNVVNSSAAQVFTFNPIQQAGSPVIDYIPTTSTPTNVGGVPSKDFLGKPRPDTSTSPHPRFDIGAIEYQEAVTTPILVVSPSPLAFGNVVDGTTTTVDLTLHNDGAGATPTIAIGTLSAPFSRVITGTFPAGAPNCALNLAAGNSCTIRVQFAPPIVTTNQNYTGSLTITANGGTTPVNGAPVSITGTGAAIVRTATVAPNALAFGNWATGTTSNAMAVTVTNSGNVALTGGAFTFSGGSALFSRPAGTAGGTCATGTGTLAAGATCTINVVFAPGTTTGAVSRTLTVAYTGATVTPASVTLTGTGVTGRATVTVLPNPLIVTLPAGTNTGSGTVTFTNTAAAGGSNVSITNVTVSGLGVVWGWTKGTDGCIGTSLAPSQSCTVQATFGRFLSPGTHNGTITFTDNATTASQSATLRGVAQ